MTRFYVKALFHLGNKSHTIQLFTRILQDGCSKKTQNKGAMLVSAYEKLFVEAYHKKNFQVKDGEHDSIIFPDRFLSEAISNYQAFLTVTRGLF